MKPNLSRHAATRSQQRGISASAIDFLLEYGSEHHDHRGAIVVLVDGAAARRIARVGDIRRSELDALRGLYAVVASGWVRTVGHRTRRLQRH